MRILVAKEKNAKRYFVAEDRDALGTIALKLLKERFEENRFRTLEDIAAERIQLANRLLSSRGIDYTGVMKLQSMSKELLDTLPPDVKGEVLRSRELSAATLRRIDTHFAEEINFTESLEQLMRAELPDPRLAYKLLQARQNYEYEGFKLIKPEGV